MSEIVYQKTDLKVDAVEHELIDPGIRSNEDRHPGITPKVILIPKPYIVKRE